MPRGQTILTSLTSHGGVIISGSHNTSVNGLPLARIFDAHACPIHGINCIMSCSSEASTNKRGNARLFDSCTCGAIIVRTSPDTWTTN